MRVPLLLIAVCSVGCEIWNAPDKVQKLETRVDELSAELSAITGKPVGVGKSHTPGKHDPAKVAKGHDDKPAEKSENEGPPRDVEAREGSVGLDIKPKETKGSVAELAKKVGKDFDAHEPKRDTPWAYEGPLGVEAWGKLDDGWKACSKGKQQSPIDIVPREVTASAIKFHYKPTTATVVDNGHNGQVNFGPGSSIEIDSHTYQLVELHMHTPSEHMIAGERFPLEVQLVHRDAAGKVAMIGVLYDAGADSRALEPFYKWPTKKQVETKLKKPLDPMALLPTTRTVYRYSGSLTTPPCSEGVVWNVMRRSMSETKQHIDAIAAHYKNARIVQPLGDRKVQ